MPWHVALRLVAERPEPTRLLAVEVEFRRVLQAQHHRLIGHAFLGGAPMRLEDRLPVDASLALSKNRYAATVSPHPSHAFGTLAAGSAAILSINILARRFRRASPRSRSSNSDSVHAADLFANCATQKTRVNAISAEFTRARLTH